MAPSAYHNWADGNYEKGKKHFWLMRIVGVPAGDIEVDVPAVLTFEDYLAGRDAIVQRIFELER